MSANLRSLLAMGAAALLVGAGSASAEDNVIKIGVLGVMSGPAASWGLVNKYCAETTAQWMNEKGGVEIGGKKYKIEIVSIDDKNDPKLAVSGAERLTQQDGIKYIIGPNVDTTAASCGRSSRRPARCTSRTRSQKSLYTPPASNAVLGMIASYQAGPIIYKYLKDKKGVKSVAFVARNESDPLNQRTEGVEAAKKLWASTISVSKDTYEPGTTDFFPVMTKVVKTKPDLIVLSGVAPADAPPDHQGRARARVHRHLLAPRPRRTSRSWRRSPATRPTASSASAAPSTPAIRSAYMEEFVQRYTKRVGEWNDEAGTKVYALEIILATLQRNPKAMGNIAEFKKTMPSFDMPNPFVKDPIKLKYTGTKYFQQPRQIGVPMVVNEFRGGTFQTLFVGAVEDK